eukprot:1158451-Pelagomonas_calceolata.AAC.8
MAQVGLTTLHTQSLLGQELLNFWHSMAVLNSSNAVVPSCLSPAVPHGLATKVVWMHRAAQSRAFHTLLLPSSVFGGTSEGSVASDAEKLAKPVLLGTSVSLICSAWGNNRLSCNRPSLVHACMHS